MLRLITCQTATLQVEQRADQPQSGPRMSATLWLHLHYCPYCSRYAKQTLLIAQWARAAAVARETAAPALPEAAKERMRQQLLAAG